MPSNLMKGIQEEMNRCRELVKLYKEIPTGGFGAAMIKQLIKNTEKAISSDDVVKMVFCYKKLKECE